MTDSRPTRRLAVLAASASTALLLAACGSAGEPAPDAAAGGGESGGDVSIGMSISTLNNPFFVALREGAEEAAQEAGVELQISDAQNDPAAQLNQLQTFLTQQVDAIVINPVDSDAAAAAVAPALAEDVPVVAVDRAVNDTEVASTVSSDNVEGGRLAAQALAESIGGSGRVVVLQGIPGTSASRERGQGFTEGIAEFPDVEVVASQPADFDRATALDVMTNLLQANPDITGVFAENDEMALGAVQALGDRAGSQVQVVGFDGTEEGVAAVADGTMAATVAQLPRDLGRESVEAAIAAARGETLEPEQKVAVEVVTQENVAEFQTS